MFAKMGKNKFVIVACLVMLMCVFVYNLVQLYKLGVSPRHLDGDLHDVLLLRHVDSS